MSLPEITAVLVAIGAAGAAIAAGPAVWRFVSATARLPRMTEAIWREFGRNGGSTTRDRIEEIARQVVRTAEMQELLTQTIGAHTASDALAFSLISGRLDSMEHSLEAGRFTDDKGRADDEEQP